MRRALTVADSLPSEWLVTSTDWPFILYLSPFLSNSGNFLLPLQNCTSARVHGRELHEPTHPHRTRCQFPVEVERQCYLCGKKLKQFWTFWSFMIALSGQVMPEFAT